MTAPYDFTTDWHVQRESLWQTLFLPSAGKPGLRFLEIGSYEGRSAVWLLENVLTGVGSRLTCVDPWQRYDQRHEDDFAAVRLRFFNNVEAREWPAKVFVCRTTSRAFLPEAICDGRKYDCVYVDGSHDAADVLHDAVLSWSLLDPGGLLLFDDYNWRPKDGGADCPATAITAFMAAMEGRFTLIAAGAQVALRKDR